MNYKFSKFFIVTLLLLAVSIPLHAQQTNGLEDDSTMIYDVEDSADIVEDITPDTSVTENVITNGNDSMQKWKNSAGFAYIKNLDSLLRKGIGLKADTISIDKNTGKKRAASAASAANSNSLLNSFPIKIFLWVIAVLFIGFFIYKLFFTAGLFANANTRRANDKLRMHLQRWMNIQHTILLLKKPSKEKISIYLSAIFICKHCEGLQIGN